MDEPPPEIGADCEIDASGLRCPLPVIMTARRMRTLAGGQVVKLIADDPATPRDVREWCAASGHELVAATTADSQFFFWVRRRKLQ